MVSSQWGKKIDVFQEERPSHPLQGVVTYMSRVEAFATRIKMNQAIKSLFMGQIREQGGFQAAEINRSRMQLQFDL